MKRLPQYKMLCGKKPIVRERDSNRVDTGKLVCRSCYDLRRRNGTHMKDQKKLDILY